MNFKRYFISIAVLLCVLSASSFAAQILKAIAISGGEEHSLVLAENGEVLAAGDDWYGQLGLGYSSYYPVYLFHPAVDGEMDTTTNLLEDISSIAAGWVRVEGIAWENEPNGVVGYFKFIYHSGEVSVSIVPGSLAVTSDFSFLSFSEDAIIFRDPNE